MTINGPDLNPSSTSRDDDSTREAERVARVSDEKRAQFLSALRNSEASRARPGHLRGQSSTPDRLSAETRANAKNRASVWNRFANRSSSSPERTTTGPGEQDPERTLETDQATGGPQDQVQTQSSRTPRRPTPTVPTPLQGARGQSTIAREQPDDCGPVCEDLPNEEPPDSGPLRVTPDSTQARRRGSRIAGLHPKRFAATKPTKGDSRAGRKSTTEGTESHCSTDASLPAAAEVHAREVRRDTKSDSRRDEGSGDDETDGKPIHGLMGFTGSVAKTPVPVPASSAGRVPSAVLQQVIEFASVHHNTRGEAEFHLGLVAGAAGGMRLKITALGKRRFGIRVRCADKHAISDLDAQVAALVEKLRESDLEVVEVEIAPTA